VVILEGLTAILRRTASVHPWALVAVVLVSSAAHAKGSITHGSALVWIADGAPFTVIRGDDLRTGTKGITLAAGDIVETGPDNLLVIQMQGGSLVGIGPSSAVYWAERGGSAVFFVREGWLKADVRAEPGAGVIRVMGPHLGVECQKAVVLLHTSEKLDAIFDEQGSAALLMRDGAAPALNQETRASQFLTKDDGTDVLVQSHVSLDFLAQMPAAFRDSLPENLTAPSVTALEPKWARKVTYPDIEPWLTARRDWRVGFVARFRGRLKDRSFFSAMDAHLSLHPEWAPILHPAPLEEDGSPAGPQPLSR
jgi:hypothetical protein